MIVYAVYNVPCSYKDSGHPRRQVPVSWGIFRKRIRNHYIIQGNIVLSSGALNPKPVWLPAYLEVDKLKNMGILTRSGLKLLSRNLMR